MNDVAVIFVLRSGGDYCSCDVSELLVQLKRNTTVPFDFYCLTDMPTEAYPTIPLIHGYKGWWSKIELFRPGLVQNKRVLYFDLDTMITGNVGAMLKRTEPFIALRPFNNVNSEKTGYFASGVMGWENGLYDYFYNTFDYRKHTGCYRGDQDYLSSEMKSGVTYWQDVFSGIASYKRHIITGMINKEDARVVCFHGRPRPKEVQYDA